MSMGWHQTTPAHARDRQKLNVIIKVFYVEGEITPKTRFFYRYGVLPTDEERTCKTTITVKFFDKDGNEIADSEKKHEDTFVAKKGIEGKATATNALPFVDAPQNAKGVLATMGVEARTTSGKTGSDEAFASSGTKDIDDLKDPSGTLTMNLNHEKFSLTTTGKPRVDWEFIIKVEKGGKLFNSPVHGTVDLDFTFFDENNTKFAVEHYAINIAGGTGFLQSHTFKGVGKSEPLPQRPTSYRLVLLDEESAKKVKSGKVKMTTLVSDDGGENQGFLEKELDVKIK